MFMTKTGTIKTVLMKTKDVHIMGVMIHATCQICRNDPPPKEPAAGVLTIPKEVKCDEYADDAAA